LERANRSVAIGISNAASISLIRPESWACWYSRFDTARCDQVVARTRTSILAKELRGRNITVNAIAPGPTATRLFLDGKPQEVIDRLSKMAPLERLGQPQDIADAVAFLAGPDGAWINGQTLRANGGII
jgi:Enoyl-(Acyl carrier protein) reductase